MRTRLHPVLLLGSVVLVSFLAIGPSGEESNGPKAAKNPSPKVEVKSAAVQTKGAEAASDLKSAEYKKNWWRSAVVDEYRRCGKTNAAWDAIVISAIEDLSELILHDDVDSVAAGLMERIGEKAKKASDLGCDDALLGYFKLRYGKGRDSDKYFSELFYGYVACAEALDKTEYHPMRKVYANFHACKFTLNTNPPLPQTADRAKALLRYSMEALQDPKLPVDDAATAADCAVWIASHTPDGKKQLEAQVFPILEKNWREYAFSYIAQGNYFTEEAWNARGHDYADGVTKEGWKGFEANLAKADATLRKGWEVDRTNVKLPIAMISVCMGESAPRKEMEKWFERAMKIDPNSYAAVMAKAYYLLPKWLGTPEELLSFGHECVETKEWGGEIPLALVWIHHQLRSYYRVDAEKYYTNKLVWRDFQASYDRFFQLNPKDVEKRYDYARDAYKCGQYKVFIEQVRAIGSPTDYDKFYGREKFEEMMKKAVAATSI